MFDVQGVTLHFGARLVLSNASFKLEDGERAAIVGPNGTGKSTLLKVIAGLIQAESGQVSYPKSSEIGYLPQDLEVLSDCSVEDECRKVFEEVLKHEREMRELEHRMSEVPHGTPEFDVIAERYEYLLHETERRDIYTMDSEIARVLAGLGFKPEDLKRPCRTFSGGWQMRIALGKLLLQNPDILLLDEPTNHLDIESIEWLAEWIKGHRGCVLMVSHERFFMDALVTKVVEVDRGNVIVYRGNYTDSLRMREERKEQMRRTYENQQLEIAHIQKFIDRFRYQASKAAMVQSRVKMLEKMEIAPSPPPDQGTINFRFPPAPRSAKEVIVVDDVAKSFGEKRVFHDVSFTLYRGEKVALVGHNGAGKTTLMKCIAGGLEQDRGKVTIGGNVDMAYFAQYDREDLHPQNTVLDEFMSSAPLSVSPIARAILGAFLFTGDDVEKKIAVLSGGERTRLRLAKMLCGKANLLLMDEPTNHLDIGSRLTLETALRQYDGAVLLVSHDRYFLDAVVTRVVEIDNGVVTSYPGNYDDYLRLKAAREAAMGAAATNGKAAARAAEQAPTPVVSADKILADINSVPRRESKDERRRRQDEQKETQKKLTKAKKRVEELEEALYRAEEAVGAAENALAKAAADRAGDKIGELNKALEKAKAQKKRIEDEWFAATQEAEELGASLSES